MSWESVPISPCRLGNATTTEAEKLGISSYFPL